MNEVSAITVRAMVPSDIDECMEFAMPLFAKRFPHMDPRQVRAWAEIATQSPFYCCVRTEKAAGIALVSTDLFEPLPRGKEIFVAAAPDASPFESVSIYRAMIEWARQNNYMPFTFGSSNGAEIEAIAKRLNAEKVSVSYRVED